MSDPATCPRCRGDFLCGAKDARCECFDVKLDDATRERIGREFCGCLCLACLKALASGAEVSESSRPQ